MKVSGFTFVRNAITYDYPVTEAISSILGICDEFIVMLGNSEDATHDLIRGIGSEKIKIYFSTWDDSLRKGGKVLAVETDKALEKISTGSDWAFYIQADEVVHERFLPRINDAMQRWKDDRQVEGLLFRYRHFYGSYDYIGDSPRWYRQEVRIVRPHAGIHSFRDAQGFRKSGRPLNVKEADAEIYHYGWVKPPDRQQAKQQYFHSLWHDEEWMKKNIAEATRFDYSKIDSLARFDGTHPAVMQKRIVEKNWSFSFDPSGKKLGWKSKFKMMVERIFGFRIGEYRNYRLLK